MSDFFTPPKPKSLLGFHQVLSPTGGIKVSPLCLGSMNFGTAWESYMGECSKENSFAIMDTFFENGGNFIDSANAYHDGQSEQWIGEWMKQRGNRDQMVIATKYTTGCRRAHAATEPIQSNFVGNSIKSMHLSVKQSLENLQTDYIDILYVHWWDFTTSVAEVMHGLNALVLAGKVLYLGISDTPAWVVVKANEYARSNGLRTFSVYQGRWSAAVRDVESEIVPMCRDQGLAIAPFASLGQGRFRSAEQRQEEYKGSARGAVQTEADIKISDALEEIAKRRGTTIHAIALAWIRFKTPYVFPIIGQRKVEHLKANIEALKIDLSKEEMDEIDNATAFDPGFPMNFILGDRFSTSFTAADVSATRWTAYIDAPTPAMPVRPRKDF
ncbi:sterigmatocystin biosynthesis dehydrogenase stcV [Aspergillus sclerotioniger CBS 115572]|uniref:Sterigmatocystin biosynthesis dehydrogenase stcV n=1 Tax=Aspergillus sclerotioniger CBS 115572 TaxID=1450535 RepID=A0A317UZL6_9EURO|nr:sterigmatocystin biosynthesis dehydrogenase stcV [Aspergillus sclerotioniger CBS 115572]PWY67225.1 sterigmatocystin biosynthesis dehydrogenase stcV [Aspergillus sclerotioniger CBS 115572]